VICSLASFVHIIRVWSHPEKKKKKRKKKRKKKKKKKKKKKRGLIASFIVVFGGCFCVSFVSRLASLARSRLGPA
jgi:cell division septal protein FtsQ